MLCAFVTPETDEQKEGKPNPRTAGSVCDVLRFPNVSELLMPSAFTVSRRSREGLCLAGSGPETQRKY